MRGSFSRQKFSLASLRLDVLVQDFWWWDDSTLIWDFFNRLGLP